MSNIAIKVEGVGKQYRLGEVGTGTLSHDLNRFFARIRGKEDPFAKIGDTNDRTAKGNSDYVWALKDINFEVKQGEVLGIIGRNGAGKSTLLKILSKVTQPTTGQIKIKGKIASLLEVGTGFHPEMTGRENIFQNGAILGMRKAEIKSKLDEIIDFAGVERYIDTPVKRYSSGMYVRLAFAVAAFLEPEILIVDEVLAVGDAEFQKKCLGRMKDVSVNDGRTVLFVSHNLPAVKQLCNRALYLVNGQYKALNDTDTILKVYKDDIIVANSTDKIFDSEKIKLLEVSIKSGNESEELSINNDIIITTVFECKEANKSLAFSCKIYNDEDILLFEAPVIFAEDKNSLRKKYIVDLTIPSFTLNSGDYRISIIFGESQKYLLLDTGQILNFTIEETPVGIGSSLNKIPGIFRPRLSYVIR